MRGFASRQGIWLTSTPSWSAFSNGGNERGHAVIDLTIKKLMEDDDKLPLEKALDHALYARNIEIGKSGFSPQQLAFGQGSVIPGITEGNRVTDERITESEAVRKHFNNQKNAREAFLKYDSSARIKKALDNRVPKYNDAKHEVGDKVFFQDERNKWQGPAHVVTTDGRTTWLRWQGILRKSHANKIDTFHVEEEESIEDAGNESENEEISDADQSFNENNQNTSKEDDMMDIIQENSINDQVTNSIGV